MANTLVTSTWVLKDVGMAYENQVKLIQNCRFYSNQYEFGGAKVGNVIQYRKPQQWQVTDGQAYQAQAILDQTVPIPLSNQKNIGFDWSSVQQTTEIEEVRDRYTKPAGAALASVCDGFVFSNTYRDIYNTVGVPGTTPSTTLLYLQAGVKLTDQSAPMGDRFSVLDPMAAITIANTTTTLFNPTSVIAGNYREGLLGNGQLMIAEWYQDQNRALHTTGTFTASTPIINGASQTGSSLITSGWAAGASSLKKGDTFTVANVFSVNKLSYISTGRLQQFTVTADISDTAGAMTIAISPSIITSGPLQTVNTSPANSAALTVWSANPVAGTLATTASPQSLVLHPEAIAFVTADLEMPIGGAEAARISSPAGRVALRMAKAWDPRTDTNITRIDTIIGAATLRPEWACRVVG